MSKRAATLKSLIFSPIFPYIIVLKPSQLYRYVGQIFMIRLTLSIKTRVPYKTVFIEVILLLLMQSHPILINMIDVDHVRLPGAPSPPVGVVDAEAPGVQQPPQTQEAYILPVGGALTFLAVQGQVDVRLPVQLADVVQRPALRGGHHGLPLVALDVHLDHV